MKIYRTVILGVILAVSIIGCDMGTEPEDDETNGSQDSTVSYSQDIQPIFNNNCIGCHPGNGDLSLEASDSYGNLVGVTSFSYAPLKRVVPSKPDSSVLYQKIRANPTMDVGQRMPQGGALSGDQIEAIKTWIAEGAPDN